MRKLLLIVSGLLLANQLAVANPADLNSIRSLEDLMGMKQDSLDEMYKSIDDPGQVPDGSSDGKAIFFPGSFATHAASRAAALIWQGKVFTTKPGDSEGVLLNRVFGFRAIRARVGYGKSLLDGKKSIIIDYAGSSLAFGWVRDEVRQVGPGIYLGRAYARTFWGPVFALNFALNFNR
jgi:hypothetical protein